MVGATISHYKITEKLGEGGMGVVYKAEDLQLERTVALKFLAGHLLNDEEAKARFLREAKAAAGLHHPNICPVHEIGGADGKTFLSMAFIKGEPLEARIEPGPLPLKDVLEIGRQIAEGLEAAHEEGVVHRDIKPANVMIDAKGRATIMDFGLARLTEASRLTKVDQTMGTVAYMSPEQAQGMEVDGRSDIWSLGVVLYEMVRGQRPFQGEYDQALLYEIVHEEPDPLTSVRVDVPMELEFIVGKCLAKDRADRPSSAEEIARDLRTLAEKLKSGRSAILRTGMLPGPTAGPTGTGSGAAAGGTGRTREKIAWTVAAAAILVAAGLSFTNLGGKRSTTTATWKVTPLTAYEGSERNPALSPNGEQVVFIWEGEKGDNADVYVRLVAGGQPLRLTSDPLGEASPSWSPDGQQIAFLRGESVFVIPALGGPERRLKQFAGERQLRGSLAWSPDGGFLAMTTSQGIARIDLGTAEDRLLTEISAPTREDFLCFSPDGRALAFVRGSSQFVGAVYVLPLDADGEAGGEPQRITEPAWYFAGLDWSSDGESLLAAARSGSRYVLWTLPASGGDLTLLPVDSDGVTDLSYSRHGKSLVYQKRLVDTNIWQLPGPAAKAQAEPGKQAQPMRLISSSYRDSQPRFSPDGKRIVFSSSRTGQLQLWRADLDGTGQMQLTNMDSHIAQLGSPQWSPDGRSIVFDTHSDGNSDIYVVSSEGGTERRLTSAPSNETRPSYSSDGQWIYFASDRSGRNEIWQIPVGGGETEQVTEHGGDQPIETADGKTLIYWNWSDQSIWKKPLGGGSESLVVKENGLGLHFGVAGRSVFYGANETEAEPKRISVVSLDSGEKFVLYRFPRGFPGFEGGNSVAVSPDGQTVLFAQRDYFRSDLMLVEGLE